MSKTISVLALLASLSGPVAGLQERPADEVIVAAISPLPTDLRSDAGVLHESVDGAFIQLRESTNGMSCVLRQPSDPAEPFLDARCYSDLFWPAVLHNWATAGPDETPEESRQRMHAAIEAGAVPLPSQPTAGYRAFGPLGEFDFESGALGPSIQKWQSIHLPFQTSEALGFTEAEEGSKAETPGLMPFVMASGSWWSHVMIMHEPWPWG